MLRLGLLIAVPIVVFDQLTKWWVLADLMDPPQAVAVTSFFNLVLVWNRGVSFGLFDSDSHWGPIVLSAFALAISVVLVVWLRKVGSRLPAVAIGMVLGGAIGNVIDRVRFGAVVDFLDFHAFGYHWPAFNVADSAISIGVGLLLYDGLFENRRKIR
ncbi:MAG: signal peptidase II [Alphaproteobacteria bacterium]|nr:signal peptidase II [Alphaproteobacteria bacterium]